MQSQLDPAELEGEFRANGLAADRRVATGLMLLAIGFLIISFRATQFAGEGANFARAMRVIRASMSPRRPGR